VAKKQTKTRQAPKPDINPSAAPRRNRAVAVFVSLVGTVTFTIVLLAILAPPPLAGTLWQSLYAFNGPDTADATDGIFQTQVDVVPSRWRFIYVHHSRTLSGDAESLAKTGASDHFVIGNGDGCFDGEIEMTQRWNHQQSVTNRPDSLAQVDSDCISICVVGDFDRTVPTANQQRHLAQLVGTLQSRLGIGASGVKMYDVAGNTAGIGHAFPVAAFKSQILP
jgi:hypothetical protein